MIPNAPVYFFMLEKILNYELTKLRQNYHIKYTNKPPNVAV